MLLQFIDNQQYQRVNILGSFSCYDGQIYATTVFCTHSAIDIQITNWSITFYFLDDKYEHNTNL